MVDRYRQSKSLTSRYQLGESFAILEPDASYLLWQTALSDGFILRNPCFQNPRCYHITHVQNDDLVSKHQDLHVFSNHYHPHSSGDTTRLVNP